MSKNTAVAAAQTSAIALSNEVPEWLKKGNRGSEDVTASDLLIPRLSQIQALSKQIKKSDPAYIEGAEQGQLFNTLTGDIYGQSATFVPVIFKKSFPVFKNRKAGGGFFGAFATEQEANAFVAGHEEAEKLEVVESQDHYGVVINADGSYTQVVMSCSKSKIKLSRKLNSLVSMAGVDRFAKAYTLTGFEDSNAAGDDFWNLDVKPAGFVSQELYAELEAMYEMFKDTNLTTNYEQEEANSGGAGKSGAADEKEF